MAEDDGKDKVMGAVPKTDREYFIDWESNTFGFGYGTGEEHIIPALRKFLELCQHGNSLHVYRYTELEEKLTPTVAWLLINALARTEIEIIEYGTSPRYGWLTDAGKRLKEFCLNHSSEELYNIIFDESDDYISCYPEHCNCDDGPCHNPFWKVEVVR